MQVIEKPWGKEEVIEINDRYMVKKLTMWKDHRCSLQYHNIKCETIYVLSGQLRIYTGPSKDELQSRGKKLGDVDLAELDKIWNQIKETPDAKR
jgi:mannose-6-phosphate isomerase-like protein (cupin superfamily)